MYIDLTLPITAQMRSDYSARQDALLAGHLGTHFDVMDKVFPLDYLSRKAVIFDVSGVSGRDIGLADIDIDKVQKNMFVAFYSAQSERYAYGRPQYREDHPQLSYELIDALLDRKISLIGIDFPGIRRHEQHTPADQYCADRGVFIIENLCDLKKIVEAGGECIINTYPLNHLGLSGLPCRVVAQL